MAEHTQSSAHVGAPASAVLAVIEDLEAYPAWTGSVRAAEVLERGADGRPRRARLTLEGGPIRDSYVLAYTWDVAADGTGRVSWHLDERGSLITALDGAYTLVPEDGGTRVTYDLAVDVRVPMLGALRRRAEKSIVSTALSELARKVGS